MTVQEAHIEFDLLLAQVGSYVGDSMSPHKKDWFLTMAQLQFVKDHIERLKRGVLEDTRINAEAIQGLKTTMYRPVNVRGRERFAILPPDYLSGINEQVEVGPICSSTVSEATSVVLPYVAFKFNPAFSAESIANKFAGFSITLNYDADPSVVFLMSNYYPTGIDVDTWWYIIPIILRYAKRPGIDIYWERWNDIYRPGHFIFVQEAGQTQSLLSITFQYNLSPNQQQTIFVLNRLFERVDRPENYELTDTRLVSSEHRQRITHNPFRRTRPNSPITTIRGNNLIIDGDFDVYGVTFEYYRLPAAINHVTGQGFEIAAGVGSQELIERQIISTAVRKAVAATEAGNYQLISAESILDQ